MADQQDIETLAKLGYFEARGESTEGMAGVMYTALNRLQRPERFGGETLQEIVSAPNQYSGYDTEAWAAFNPNTLAPTDRAAWNRNYQVAAGVLNGQIADPTDGADHFLNPALTRKQNRGKLPTWTRKYEEKGTIGAHQFWRATD